MSLPFISHPTDRPNFSVVHIGNCSFWFSYETCIAFRTPAGTTRICENAWGPTTGKHLNWIDSDKAKRIPRTQFQSELSNVVSGQNVLYDLARLT